jgi:hypothetical protein
MSTYLREGDVAPKAFILNLKPEDVAMANLSTVTSAVLNVRRGDGTITTWTATLSNQTSTTLTLTHLLGVGDVTTAGVYVIRATLTLTAGTVRSEPQRLRVLGFYEVV